MSISSTLLAWFISYLHLKYCIPQPFINSGDIDSDRLSLLTNINSLKNLQNVTEGSDKPNKILADFCLIFISFRHNLISFMPQTYNTQYKYPTSNLIITFTNVYSH